MEKNKVQSRTNKRIVITGASSGVGKCMAIELAKEGHSLVLAARREEALQEVVDECIALGGDAIFVVTDVRESDEVAQLAQAAMEWRGSIDVWINNAGVLAAGEVTEIPEEVAENVVRTNLLGYMHGAHEALHIFKQQGYGVLINNISVGGWLATPYMSAYSATKWGLRGFFESLKGELHAFPNIHVCDLYPAFLDTPGMQHAANFTGKVLRPAPPVYDPRKVAKEVAYLVKHPKPKVSIGAASLFLKWSYALMPSVTRNVVGTAIRKYLESAEPIEETSGNVLQPVAYGSGIDGGWRPMLASMAKKKSLLVAGAVMAGLILVSRK